MGLFDDNFKKTDEYGEVVEITHPIVTIVGLPNVKVNEMVVFDNDQIGEVRSIKRDTISILIYSKIPAKVGQKVTRLNEIMQLNLTQDLLGKVVDAKGNVISDIVGDKNVKTELKQDLKLQIDKLPPSMDLRLATSGQFLTGVSLIDLLIPIGVGQRELVVGDRKTGKTSFLLSILKNQVESGQVVIYVSIGSNISETKIIQNFIDKHKLAEKIVFVMTSSDSSHGDVLISPYTGMTIAEYYKSLGQEVVLVLDNLSTHAMYYREVSILSKRFPGRDSYPGDIFYFHARLLERAGSFMSKGNNKGSITCFPVAQTVQNDLSDYIVSNLISITDGHILFDANEFAKGKRPAVNIALSVTRLGRQTQSLLLQDINRQLSSFLTVKYEKSLQLSHFGSELTNEVQRDLEVGGSLNAFFNQDIGLVVTLTPVLVFIGMIWLDMFTGSAATKIVVFRDILAKNYRDDKDVQIKLDKMVRVKTFKELLVQIIVQKEDLLKICKAKHPL